MYDGAGPHSASTAVFQTATYGQGPQPCHLQVTSAGGGHFQVVSATGSVLFSKP